MARFTSAEPLPDGHAGRERFVPANPRRVGGGRVLSEERISSRVANHLPGCTPNETGFTRGLSGTNRLSLRTITDIVILWHPKCKRFANTSLNRNESQGEIGDERDAIRSR
jgi:hypothetical protein